MFYQHTITMTNAMSTY